MWKMATRNEWDELQYHNNHNKENQDRKLNDTDANDDGDNNATAHFTACVALHNWARARSPVPCTFSSHSHIWLKFEPRPHFHSITMVIHVVVFSSTWLPSSTSSPSSCPFSFSPSSMSATSSSRSSIRRSWKTCATPRQTGVRTLMTSSTSPQVMSPRPMTSTSSRTHRSPSPSRSLPRTRTWMTWHSARCSLKHTEGKSITSNKKACQSVSRRRL